MQSRVLEGHYRGIKALAWSPDGKVLVSVSDDKTTCIWDRTGENLRRLEGTESIPYMLAWRPDGRGFATVEQESGMDKDTFSVIGLWDRKGGLIKRYKTAPVRVMAWSPDGQLLATGSVDKMVYLWSRSGKLVQKLEGHNGTVYSLAWSPKSEILVSARGDGEIFFWDKEWNFVKAYHDGAEGYIVRLRWSPEGDVLASFAGGRIYLWNEQGTFIRALTYDERVSRAHTEDMVDLAWSPDGNLLATASWDRTILIWEQNGKCLKRIMVPDSRSGSQYFLVPRSISWAPDGETLAATFNDGTLRFWSKEWECIGTGKLNIIRKTRISVTPLSIFREEDIDEYDDKALWAPTGKAIAAWERNNSRIVVLRWITSKSSESAIKTPEKGKLPDKIEKCPICHQNKHETDELSECHYCGTIFHSRCILKWVLEEDQILCPECNNLFIIVVG